MTKICWYDLKNFFEWWSCLHMGNKGRCPVLHNSSTLLNSEEKMSLESELMVFRALYSCIFMHGLTFSVKSEWIQNVNFSCSPQFSAIYVQIKVLRVDPVWNKHWDWILYTADCSDWFDMKILIKGK